MMNRLNRLLDWCDEKETSNYTLYTMLALYLNATAERHPWLHYVSVPLCLLTAALGAALLLRAFK
jgi:hypothetical protein